MGTDKLLWSPDNPKGDLWLNIPSLKGVSNASQIREFCYYAELTYWISISWAFFSIQKWRMENILQLFTYNSPVTTFLNALTPKSD